MCGAHTYSINLVRSSDGHALVVDLRERSQKGVYISLKVYVRHNPDLRSTRIDFIALDF
jgi:hypothetical protein